MARGEMAMSSTVNLGSVRTLQKTIDANSEVIDSIVNRLVNEYCSQLDEYMDKIRIILDDPNNPPTDLELDDMTLRLPMLLYFTGEAQEALGIHEDVAKAMKQENFNEVYNLATGTIGDKTAAAELATQNEFIAHIGYQRAYKKVKLRMELANEMLQSVKKVMSRRMQEYDLTRIAPDRIGGR